MTDYAISTLNEKRVSNKNLRDGLQKYYMTVRTALNELKGIAPEVIHLKRE